MNTLEILRYGTPVRLANVDLYGFCGRDNHPEPEDVGFLGLVVGNIVMVSDEDGSDTFRENVLGGVQIDLGTTRWGAVCYKVRSSDGRELELMSHEIEVLGN